MDAGGGHVPRLPPAHHQGNRRDSLRSRTGQGHTHTQTHTYMLLLSSLSLAHSISNQLFPSQFCCIYFQEKGSKLISFRAMLIFHVKAVG